MTTISAGRKILCAHESSETPLGIPALGDLIKNLRKITNEELAEVVTVDFSHFWTEQSWEEAVSAAKGADLIVITLSGSTELPMPVQRWVENWPHHQLSDLMTLVVIFDQKDSQCPKQAALTAFFQQIAELHGLEFICNRLGAPALAGFAAN